MVVLKCELNMPYVSFTVSRIAANNTTKQYFLKRNYPVDDNLLWIQAGVINFEEIQSLPLIGSG